MEALLIFVAAAFGFSIISIVVLLTFENFTRVTIDHPLALGIGIGVALAVLIVVGGQPQSMETYSYCPHCGAQLLHSA